MTTFLTQATAALCLLVASLSHAASPAPKPVKPGPVWSLSSQCSAAKGIAVEVSLDGKAVYKTSISICRGLREDTHLQPAQDKLAFSLKDGGRSILGEPAGEPVEGNIWEAGETADNLIFGVSFATNGNVPLNALHVVYPDKQSRSELGQGLAITTYPVLAETPPRQGKDAQPPSTKR